MSASRWAVVSLFVSGLAMAAYGGFVEPARLVVHRDAIAVPHWPPALSGLRVAFVADLHVGSPHWGLSRIRDLVAAVNAERPDLILLGGDYRIHGVLFGAFVPETAIADALAGLRAPLGVYCVLGNHDVSRATKGPFEARGLHVLEDEVVAIPVNGTVLELLGLKDEEVRTRSGPEELALAPPGPPLLVLMHEPDAFAELDDRVSLALAAHTHGGQVRLPWIGAPIPHSRYGQRYLAGHVVESGRHLFVTTGVGTSVLPIRIGVPPEFAVLTLRSADRAEPR